eukprot:12674832-Alexandrium_andersonii.AAC.1
MAFVSEDEEATGTSFRVWMSASDGVDLLGPLQQMLVSTKGQEQSLFPEYRCVCVAAFPFAAVVKP